MVFRHENHSSLRIKTEDVGEPIPAVGKINAKNTVSVDTPEVLLDIENRMLQRATYEQKRKTVLAWTIRVLLLVAVLLAWQLLADGRVLSPQLTSSPTSVARAFQGYFSTGGIWVDIRATFEASVLGLLIGSVPGVIAGVFLVAMPVVHRAVRPYITVLNALPRVALAPIALVWFGLGIVPKVAVASSIVFFVLLLNTIAGSASSARRSLL